MQSIIHCTLSLFGVVIILCSNIGCDYITSSRGGSKDPIVVTVGNHTLHQSEINSLLTDGTSRQDSVVIVDGYVQNWIRENLMIIEAEKTIANDINIDKLVSDYRSSLLVDNYEKQVVEKTLDTIVDVDEIKAYYDSNKGQYILSHPIFKGIVSKIPLKDKGIESVRRAFEKSDLTEAIFMVKEKSTYLFLDTSRWVIIDDIRSMIPAEMASKNQFRDKKTNSFRDKDYQYFVKILKFYDESEIPPLSYIKDKIAKVILNDRKTILLKQIRQNLYDEGIRNKLIDIRTK